METETFNYRTLRLLVGVIALALPWVVTLVAAQELTSISASYYTDAQDLFVGMLFVVGAFMWAYNGHTPRQSLASKLGALAAIMVALFPTTCDGCDLTWESVLHFGSAIFLFCILSYFCFIYFRTDIKATKQADNDSGKNVRYKHCGSRQTSKERWRSGVYFICGVILIACMVFIGLSYLFLDDEMRIAWKTTYWGEAIALTSFGVAWFTSGKLRFVADEKDALELPSPRSLLQKMIKN